MLTKHRDFHGNTEWTLRLADHQIEAMDRMRLWMLQFGLRLITLALTPSGAGREREHGE